MTEKTDAIQEEEGKEAESIEEQLEAAQAQAAEYLQGWQRERAEFTNYKRRVERERAETYQTAKLEVLSQFLPVLDDFDRAMENIPEEVRETDWVQGIHMIRRKTYSILQSLGVTEIDALGHPFDPTIHEAVSRDESEEYESDHVMDVLQKGYRHGDRVLRPAMVRVAM